MNEKIKELALQAGIISAEYNGFDSTSLTTSQRKFAELIVKECMNTIAESREVRQTAYYYRNRVAEHFGVKE